MFMGSGAAFYVLEDLERTRRRRNRRKPFSKSLRYFKDQGIKNKFPKITQIQINAIREKIKKQDRKDRDRLILAFIIAIPVFIGITTGIARIWSSLNI
ncbi:hypothetical protein [Kordia sp.]|uniref:hypothetical protein n=1 Tax=Kordia sp. TaxID=1965332 RepID=UPI003B58F64B